ncbi:hypothetical protein B0189_06075 [Moraxella cuniculi]|nr:hypothetical protein B0189_06075 [Moraxella cuniculi]
MLLSSLASSMYLIVLPLYVYHLTNSAISTAFQVTVSAIGSLLSCFFVNNFNLFKSDKNHIVAINVCLSLLLCLSYFFSGLNIIYWLYLISFVATFLDTCSSGYIESLISFIAKTAENTNRQNIIAKTKIFSGMGSALGFFFGGTLLSLFEYKMVFLMSGGLFILSCIFIHRISINDAKPRDNAIKKAVYQILFAKNIFYLSTAHGVSAISLFIYNGSFIYILKNIYNVDDVYVSLYFFMMMLAAIFGSLFMARLSKSQALPVYMAPRLRTLYALLFLIVAFSTNYWYFLVSVFVLNFIHAFSIPFWQDCFQKYSAASQWRVIGTSRKTLVAMAGIVGSFLGGYLIGGYGVMITYFFAAFLALISSVLLMIFVRQSSEAQPKM